MNFYLCGNDSLTPIFSYNEPDKYIKTIGKPSSTRTWWYCPQCELYSNVNELSEEEIQNAYLKYRDNEMRGISVKKEFERINNLPNSENRERCIWLANYIAADRPQSMIDVGSGLGVFPYIMRTTVPNIYCIEPESESARFINTELSIRCINSFYKKGMFGKVDLVTLVHILEHFTDPIGTLRSIRKYDLEKGGTLFIEVPDAEEFTSLPKEHDEFNSLHLWFFNVATLDRVVRQARFKPYLVERIYYPERKLSRIRMLCK